MSGSATLGGSATQANVAAYVGAHMLARVPLGWVDLAVPDLPVAVSGETGGPGDDVRVELADTTVVLEVQVKHGLRNDVRLREAFEHFRTRLPEHPATYAVLAVDPTSHNSVKVHLREDLRRVADGRPEPLREVTRTILTPFTDGGLMELVPRIGVIELDLQHASSAHRHSALQLLRGVLAQPAQVEAAWTVLFEDALVVARERGRRTVVDLEQLLTRKGIALAPRAAEVSARPTVDDRFTAVLDRTKALLDAGQPSPALGILTLLEGDLATHDVGPAVRGRLHSHLGAACLALERFTEAQRHFERAFDYQQSDAGTLANMALARSGAGDARGAYELTTRILAADPQNVGAWQIRVQAARQLALPPEEPPELVRQSPAFISMLAHLAVQDGDWNRAEQLAGDALRRGRRLPPTLLALAQATCSRVLMSAGGRAPDGPDAVAWREAMERAAALAGEALELLEHTERRDQQTAALLVRGAAQRFLGQKEAARADFEQAAELSPLAWEPRAQLADLLLNAGRADEALFALTSLRREAEGEEPPAAVLHLKAHALIRLGRAAEAEPLLEREIQEVAGTSKESGARLGAAELLIAGGRLDAADAVLRALPPGSDAFMTHLLQGRLASGKGDSGAADEAYANAIAAAPAEADSRAARLEFADVLRKRGEYARAADEFEAAGAMTEEVGVRVRYLRTLYHAGRYRLLAERLDEMAAAGPLAPWAEELAAFIAHARDDLGDEIAHLERYAAAAPDDVERGIQLAYAYGRAQRTDDVAALVRRLRQLDDLDASECVRLGKLSVGIGDSTEGLLIGYRGLRQRPFDYDVQRGYVELVMSLRENVRIPGPGGVGPDTHVTLEAPGADPVEYLILAEGAADPGRGEALATDERVADLIGLRPGDTVVRHPGLIAERTYTVKEVKPAAVHAFQRILLDHATLFPSSTAFQMFKVGDPIGMRDLAPLIRGVEGRAAGVEAAHKMHEEQFLPLGVLATALGTDVGRIMAGCRAPGRRLMTEFGAMPEHAASVDAAERAAERGSAVVLTHSALVSAQDLGLLNLIATMFRVRIVSRALVEALATRRDEWQRIAKDGYHTAYKSDAGLAFDELPPEAGLPGLKAAEALLAWVQEHCTVTPLPVTAVEPDAAAQRVTTLGRESFAALALAARGGATMYADDLGLRMLLRFEGGESFSTWALLQAATRRGVIAPEMRDAHVLGLIDRHHFFIPVSAEFLHNALRSRGYRIDATLLKGIARLGGPEADLVSSLAVAAEFVRRVALSSVGGGSVAAIVTACAGAVIEGREARSTIRQFKLLLAARLALLPIVLAEALSAIDAFSEARGFSP